MQWERFSTHCKIFNRHTLKLSYSCMPNMKSIISSHNKHILSNANTPTPQPDTCNCRKKPDCPLLTYFYYLFLRRYLLACRQELINSVRLCRVPKSGLQIIKYFSQRHKLQRLEVGLYGLACFKIFHDTLKLVLVSFNCQMCLLSSVLCFLLGVEKEALWFANLVLKRVFSYVGLVGSAVVG